MIQKSFSEVDPLLREHLLSLVTCYHRAGYQCYLVGGCVRDLLLGLIPKDFDLATDCPLEVTQTLFKRVIPTGVDHGTLTILSGSYSFEVTRFRKDVETDGRRAVVAFAKTIEEDQLRRDLKINALAFNPIDGTLVDSQGGLEDFKNKKIHFVGRAAERIKEDHLRAIRYLRMIAKLAPYGFTYDPDELLQVQACFDGTQLSLERIYEELNKIRKIPSRDNLFLTKVLTTLQIFSGRLSKSRHSQVIEQLLTLEDQTPLAFWVAVEKGLKFPPEDLRLSKKEKRMACLLLERKEQDWTSAVTLKSYLSALPPENRAYGAQAAEVILGVPVWKKSLDLLAAGEPLVLADLELSSSDLINRGFKGKALGRVHREILKAVWLDPGLNQRQELLRLVDHFI